MAAPQDVHVRICNQEIVKFDLEVKALIQVFPGLLPGSSSPNPRLRWPPVSSAVSLPSFPLLVKSQVVGPAPWPATRLWSPLGPVSLTVGPDSPSTCCCVALFWTLPCSLVPDQAYPLWPPLAPPPHTSRLGPPRNIPVTLVLPAFCHRPPHHLVASWGP